MDTDLTFFTNESGSTLLDRFTKTLKDGKYFDILVGYFRTSGFFRLYQSFESIDKIRILVGLNIDKNTYDIIEETKQTTIDFETNQNTRTIFSSGVVSELENSEDSFDVELGVKKFIEFLQSGKLEIRAYPSKDIHAKVYILRFNEIDRDFGRVITGSSNFSESGLIANREFNVELKNSADVKFALEKFEDLWKDAVDISKDYIETVQTKTWLNDIITPYELYLKFLYEYFKEKISVDKEKLSKRYTPINFRELEYQTEAVKDAKAKLESYGGVFISDVVGLGKTFISALLANELDGYNLVIAPPVLLDEENPGSWKNVFSDFKIAADFESIGKLDKIIKRGTEKYKNVFIDEAHRFRSESNITYELLAQICRGKRVILVSATPLNNTPSDILSQIKLFQSGRNSTIPNVKNLDAFFRQLEKKLKDLDRQTDRDEYLAIVRDNAKQIRDKVLKYLMVRRTRFEVNRYFSEDLKRQNLKFPEVEDPKPVFYQFDEKINYAFDHTIRALTNPAFTYARYSPLLYYCGKEKLTQIQRLSQENLRSLMKILLIKRLESSFFAFKNSLNKFIESYKAFIRAYDNGNGSVFISKKYIGKIFELLAVEDFDKIAKLIEEDKAEEYKASDFAPNLITHLVSDLSTLEEIQSLWNEINTDPKLDELIHLIESNSILKNSKLIIFTESKDTAEYLERELQSRLGRDGKKVLAFTGQSTANVKEKIIDNFDAKVRRPKNDIKILVSTEVLSEGVNLHQSNIVINYDIPWNPTRLIQRVGRVNRIDTKFDRIYTYNFFPTIKSNDLIKLKEAAEAKIHAFIEMLGNDARLLTEGEEIKSHDLFQRLTSKKTITGEDEEVESELKYLEIIRDIRDNNVELFSKIKHLPKKARSAKKSNLPLPLGDDLGEGNSLITYFRKGKLHKFFISSLSLPRRGTEGEVVTKELDFLQSAKILESESDTKREKIDRKFYTFLEKNKEAFKETTQENETETTRGGRDNATKILRILRSKQMKNYQGFTEDDDQYIKKVINLLEDGALPKQTTKTVAQAISILLDKENGGDEVNPIKILAKIKTNIPEEFFTSHLAYRQAGISHSSADVFGPREVILSEYLIWDGK
ncbi:helicase-related protein [Stygiobacter electus]|uniref:Helicase-related protein n=1 Tax=Stygiobacter electus TaxID=3032292 RepID=A0AAE3TF16_9BACT|nr:helicase-related protein [Stygiobacter electus]MDF1612888.1 helicase-related protein [Stygiobacter electus]